MEIQGQMQIISKEIQSFQQAAIMLRDEAQMEQQFLLYPSIHLEVLLVDLAAIITGTRYQSCTVNLLKAISNGISLQIFVVIYYLLVKTETFSHIEQKD